MNVVLIEIAEKSLGSGADAHSLGEGFKSSMSNPSYFGSKSFYVVLLLLKKRLGDEHGHVYVTNARSLESLIEFGLDVLPYCISVGLDSHTALYGCVFDELGFTNDVRIPLGEILVHRSDLFNHFLICHYSYLCINILFG